MNPTTGDGICQPGRVPGGSLERPWGVLKAPENVSRENRAPKSNLGTFLLGRPGGIRSPGEGPWEGLIRTYL